MPAGGDSVPLISGRNRTISASCSARRTLVHPRPHSGTIQRHDPHRRPPTFEPDLFRARHPPAPGRSPNRSPPGAPRQTVRCSSPSPHRVGRFLSGRRPRRGQPGARRFADLYATGQIPEYHQGAWGEQIFWYPTDPRRDQQPPTSPTSVAHGFTNYATRNPRNTHTRRVCSGG